MDGPPYRPVQPMVTEEELANLRARIVDTIVRVAEAASAAGYTSPTAAALPRKYEPRNAAPEPQ